MKSYGMKLRGFSIGCQPMKGLEDWRDCAPGEYGDKYYSVLTYKRELTDKELNDYDLEEIEERYNAYEELDDYFEELVKYKVSKEEAEKFVNGDPVHRRMERANNG